jgi:hypothetical protein
VTVVCEVERSKDVNSLIYVNQNVCDNYRHNLDSPVVVYADAASIDVLCHLGTEHGDTIDRVITVPEGVVTPVGSDKYAYSKDPTTGTFTLTKTSDSSAPVITRLELGENTETIFVNVSIMFGDMVQEKPPSVFSESDESFDYLARGQDGVVAFHHRLKVPWHVNTFDGTCRTQEELDALSAGGFLVPAYRHNEFTNVQRVQMETPPIKVGNLLVDGVKRIKYSSDDQYTFVGLLEGEYQRDDVDGVVVVDNKGMVDTQLLQYPFTVASNAYVGEPSSAPGPGIPGYAVTFVGTHDEIEERLLNLPAGSRVITGETTVGWEVLPNDKGEFSIFVIKSGKIDDRIVTMSSSAKRAFILKEKV